MREKSNAPAACALQGVRILAVEDNFLVLLELTSMLRDAGATVHTCGTVAQALSTADSETFAAAVLDVRMGHESVAPVALKLTSLGTPFVFYTGQLAGDPTMAQWPKASIISKPAPPSVLVKALVAALGATVEPR